MRTWKETYLAECRYQIHECRCCKIQWTMHELEEDVGMWHVNHDWTLTCDACDESIRNHVHELREEGNDPQDAPYLRNQR